MIDELVVADRPSAPEVANKKNTNRTRPKSPREAAAALIMVNETLRSKIEAMEIVIEDLRGQLNDKEEDLQSMEREMKLALMHLAGLEAELTAFREDHSYSSLLKETGEEMADGTRKTRARVLYEEAFDREGRELGYEEPEKFRT